MLRVWSIAVVMVMGGGLMCSWAGAESTLSSLSVKECIRTEIRREWKYLVLHRTATETGSVESIDAAHKMRKDSNGHPWRGIGYHFLIGNGRGMKDGEVVATFRWKEQCEGAHAGNAEYNNQGIGICLVGNFEDEPPTPAQLKTLRELMTVLSQDCRINANCIVRHTDIKPTACPGKSFPWEALLGETLLGDTMQGHNSQLVRLKPLEE